MFLNRLEKIALHPPTLLGAVARAFLALNNNLPIWCLSAYDSIVGVSWVSSAVVSSAEASSDWGFSLESLISTLVFKDSITSPILLIITVIS